MATYQEIKAQIAELQIQAEKARKQEIASAVAQIKSLMAEYGITVADLSKSSKSSAKKRATVPPKYRDPATGKTWTGRGRAPKWIADAKNPEQYLIK
ncbi:MAG: H-NS histone family protein [Oxalobacter sp.]|nr:H-NS histone family protein [Oxalobacter sp.]